MSGGAQQQAYLLSEYPWPGTLSFGFPPRPVERDHWLIKATAPHVGRDIQMWGTQEWELAARYLAHALENSMRDYIQKSLLQPVLIKRGRGRPRKHPLTFSNALLGDLNTRSSTLRRERGRPRISDGEWLNVYEMVNSYRDELTWRKANTRITDKAAITYAAEQFAKEKGLSQAWVRWVVPKMQKRYSEAKKRVGKIPITS